MSEDGLEDVFLVGGSSEAVDEIENVLAEKRIGYRDRVKILLHFLSIDLMNNSDSLDHAMQNLLAFSNTSCRLIMLADSHGEAAWNKRKLN